MKDLDNSSITKEIDEKDCINNDIIIKSDRLDPIALSMLSNNRFQYLIELNLAWTRDGVRISFDDNKLSHIQDGVLWKGNDLIDLIIFMEAACREAEIFLISSNDISWSLNNIFKSEDGYKILYLPIIKEEKQSMDKFIRKLIALSRFDPKESSDILRNVLNELEEGTFNDLNSLSKFIHRLKNGIKEQTKVIEDSRYENLDQDEKNYKVSLEKGKYYRSGESLISVEETDEGMSYVERPSSLVDFLLEDDGKNSRNKDNRIKEVGDIMAEGIDDNDEQTLFQLLTHFSLNNLKKYRLAKKKKNNKNININNSKDKKLLQKKENDSLKTSLLPSETSAYIWWTNKKRAIALDEFPFLIGSDKGNNLVIESPYISRKHALIDKKASKIYIKNLSTTNGSKVGKCKLKKDGVEQIGDSYTFSLANEKFILFLS